MFTKLQTSLFDTKSKKDSTRTRKNSVVEQSKNSFIEGAKKNSAVISSGNGAKKYSTTGNGFVDQFGKLGTYKVPRSFQDIEKDCELLWASNPIAAVMFILYIRMITRTVSLFDGSTTATSQAGAELKHEGIMRMIWLHTKSEDTFWKNIGLFVSVGSWQDILKMLAYDLKYNGWEGRVLNWNKFGGLILSALANENTSELLKKYLPQIRANSHCKTLDAQADNVIGKWIANLLFGGKAKNKDTYRKYRELKSNGTAHQWQQFISRKQFYNIDFSKIHGRALNKLVRSKFLDNQGLRANYENWVNKDEVNVKYTGFVHELFEKLPSQLSGLGKAEQTTINKQFATLVEKAGENKATSLIVVRDTSGSMGSGATGTNMSCYNIAKALALYFSEFLKGEFANNWIEFHDVATMRTWKGASPLEKWYNDRSSYVGGTNFQSVIHLFTKLKKQGIPESDFPSGILCISDGEFNPSQLDKTNVESALDSLRSAGFSKEYISNFVIVLWNLSNNYYGGNSGQKFETYGNTPNVFYFSGYSAATVKFLTSDIKNAAELFDEAMNQEILQMVEL